MKVLDVELLRDGIRRNSAMLSRQRAEIEAIFHSVYGLVSLEDVLKGQGGDAIRAFYADCHLPFLQFFMTFEERFTEVLMSMDAALAALEPDASGFIRESFLEGEVEQGLTEIAQLTESLTDETNRVMRQVADIVSLPQLNDNEVQEGVRNAKIKRDVTRTSLYEFDATQTNALGTIEHDLDTMDRWLSDMEGLFLSGLTDVHFSAEQWGVTSSENALQVSLVQRMMPIGPLPFPESTPFSYRLPIENPGRFEVQSSPNTCEVPVTNPGDVGIDIAKGIGVGLYDAGKDFVTGIWDLIVNPVESVKGTFYAVTHPVETFTYLKTAITDSYERDVMNGDAYSRSRWFSYAVGTIGASIVGTKGAGALTKSTTVTTRSVVQNSTQSQRLMNLLPDGPGPKFTPSKDIPFNVYNGPAIRSQLLSSMKAAIARMEQPKSPAVTMKERIAAVQSQATQKSAEVGRAIDRTLTNVTNTFSKTPEFSFASGVVKPMDRPSPTIQHPGKDMVGIGEKNGSKGTVNTIHRSEIDEVIKNNYDKDGKLINRSIVPKGYNSVEDFLKQVDDTSIKKYGYDSVEEFKEVVGFVDEYLNASPKNNILNKSLAGGTHVKGVDYDVLGFPVFKGDAVKFHTKLDKGMFVASDDKQFKFCTKALKEAIERGDTRKEIFTEKQLRDIYNEEARIKGLTWHHHQVPGKMQLVVSKTHKVNHLGGNTLWGDGIR